MSAWGAVERDVFLSEEEAAAQRNTPECFHDKNAATSGFDFRGAFVAMSCIDVFVSNYSLMGISCNQF